MKVHTPNAPRRTIGAAAAGISATAATAAAAILLLPGCATPPTSIAAASPTSPAASNGTAGSSEMPAATAVTTPSSTAELPAPTSSPLVQTAATTNAASVQSAFEQVARAAAPAVVTITTLQRVPTPRPGRGMPFGPFAPFGGGGGGDGSDNGGPDPLEQLLRQFEQQLQRQQGGDGGGVGGGDIAGPQPQAFSVPREPSGMAADGPNLFRVQARRPGGGGAGPLVGAGLGSGFLIRDDGLILTNAHVVQGADRVTVKLADGREFQNAKVLGQDARTDIAVVKIPATGLPTLPMGSSQNVKVGDWAIAVGNPFGLDRTLTVGVISAVNRQVPISESGPSSYLQTDATINPGNSGGPLLDINGRVVGINDAIYSQTGGSVGIGFAVPVDTARQVANVLATQGRVRRAFLGVAVTDLSDQATAFGLPVNTKGVLVETVSPGSPAALAGLQAGDVITAFNGQTVTSSSDFQQRVGAAPIGSAASLTVLRSGKTVGLTAHLQEMKENAGGAGAAGSGGAGAAPTSPEGQPTQLGVGLAPLTPELAARLGLHAGATGTVIARVVPGSPAQVAGLQTGDVIERVGQTAVTSPAQVKAEVEAILSRQSGDQKSVALYVNRHGQRQYVIVGF